MAGNECAYREREQRCIKPGTHEVQLDGVRMWLCDRHVLPDFHPPDLRSKLPGAIRRAVARRKA